MISQNGGDYHGGGRVWETDRNTEIIEPAFKYIKLRFQCRSNRRNYSRIDNDKRFNIIRVLHSRYSDSQFLKEIIYIIKL